MIDLADIYQGSESMQMVQRTARDFAEKEIRPVAREHDESQQFPHGIMAKLGDLGFLGAPFPEEYEGAGLSAMDFTVLIEEIARVDPSVALSVCAHTGLCTSHIFLFGSQDQKKRFLPDLCSGRKLGAWGLTEASSGSDAHGMQTMAARSGNEWVLKGQKVFTTHGSVGSTFVVMAITSRTKPRPGISTFILERKMTGLAAGKKENKLGMRASDTSTLILDEVRVRAENLIGKEGEGFKQALQVLDGGRIGIAALAVGLAQSALESSLQYATGRRQFGKRLADFQAIQWKLADMATGIEAARLLTRRAAWLKMNGQKINLSFTSQVLRQRGGGSCGGGGRADPRRIRLYQGFSG